MYLLTRYYLFSVITNIICRLYKYVNSQGTKKIMPCFVCKSKNTKMRGEIIQNYHLTFRYLENIILYTLIIIIVLFLRIPLPCQENNSNELFNSQCAICFIPNFFLDILLCTTTPTTYNCLCVVCSYVHQICAWKIKYLLHHPLYTQCTVNTQRIFFYNEILTRKLDLWFLFSRVQKKMSVKKIVVVQRFKAKFWCRT